MNILKTIFKKRDNSLFFEAKKRLADVHRKLETSRKMALQEIYITEFHY